MKIRRCASVLIVLMLAVPGLAMAEPPQASGSSVVLVTADGLRWTEIFGGIDRSLLENAEASSVGDPAWLHSLYWRETAERRREALMPFFWGTLAREGIVLGNRAQGSEVLVRNPHRFSAPGYAEILVGEPVSEIDSNARSRIRRETVLEFVRRELNLEQTGVAVFASWDVFNYFTQHQPGRIFVNAGYQAVPEGLLHDPTVEGLNRLQFRLQTPWDSVRHDSVTAALALQYLKDQSPRLLYVSLGETDDWAHDHRYDRYLSSIRLFDDFLRELWGTIQRLPTYRGKTTLLVTVDHGRGDAPENWSDHGSDTEASQYIWLAALGPETPPLGATGIGRTYTQSQVAATICALFGLNPGDFNPAAAGPVDLVLERKQSIERRD